MSPSEDWAEREVRRTFDALVATDDGGDVGPDIALIRQAGGRLARRRLLRNAGITAGAAALAGAVAIGTAGVAHRSGGGVGGGVSGGVGVPGGGSVPAGEASSPSAPPTDQSLPVTESLQADLMRVLRRHLPPGLALEPGSGPTTFVLRHRDGSTSTLGALEGLQQLGGAPSPCPQYGTDCHRVTLPDSSQGWVSRGLDGRQVTVTLYTLGGQAFGLGDGDDSVKPGTDEREAGVPMTEDQLVALVQQPDVYPVLERVPTDQVHPVPSGSPFHN